MEYMAVIFDLDGTLLNTIDDLADSVNAVLSRRGVPTHAVDAYRYFVGDGVENMVRRALPPDVRDDAMVASCVADVREEYGKRWENKTRPYAGVAELLDSLTERGIKLAVLSNKPDDATKVVVRKLLARWRFDVVLGESPHRPRKPDPGGALEIAAQLDVPPANVLYVGDTDTDMQTANAAGMYAAGALWGFRDADELTANGAQTLLEQPTDLLPLLSREDAGD